MSSRRISRLLHTLSERAIPSPAVTTMSILFAPTDRLIVSVPVVLVVPAMATDAPLSFLVAVTVTDETLFATQPL